MLLPVLLLVFRVGFGLAQYDPNSNTTPVPILKQINRHNEDGSYSYGYEAADGSYKIESKYPTGEVFGKYGFVDDTGSVREVEYGASRRGFEPTGTGINVPPSTLSGNSIAGPNEPEDDGQYREDPSIYHTDPRYTNGEHYDPVPKRGYQPIQPAQPVYQQQIAYHPPAPSKSVAAAYRQPAILNSRPEYRPQYRSPQQRPQYEQQTQSQSVQQRRVEGQLAPSADARLGSYSVQYK